MPVGSFRGGASKSGRFKTCSQILKALRLTGLYLFLCLVLGEVENANFGCAFGSGWRIADLEDWKDANGNCWTWIDQVRAGARADALPHPCGLC